MVMYVVGWLLLTGVVAVPVSIAVIVIREGLARRSALRALSLAARAYAVSLMGFMISILGGILSMVWCIGTERDCQDAEAMSPTLGTVLKILGLVVYFASPAVAVFLKRRARRRGNGRSFASRFAGLS